MAVTRTDLRAIREDFPVLKRTVRGGKPLVYLDNAASTQKPRSVIEAVTRYYTERCSNVHRGLHRLSELATGDFEEARVKVGRFIGARDSAEIIFTSGTTESINLVARSFGERLERGDEILISEMEHHSNIVPWQQLCGRTGTRLQVIPINDDGELVMERFEELVGPRTRLVSVAHTSNALGTRNPVERIVEIAHARGVPVLLDGAQAMPHERIDVKALDCDLFAFSGHKMFGATGVGVLYGKADLLESMPPYQGGGEMIETVSFEETTFKKPPHRFEAGTPDIAGVIGLGAAVDYLEKLDFGLIAAAEAELLAFGTERLRSVPGLRLIGTAARKAGILGFVVDGIHSHDLGTALDLEGVAVRAGHHCAQPTMKHFGVPATVRASLALYNNRSDVEALVSAVHKAIEVLG